MTNKTYYWENRNEWVNRRDIEKEYLEKYGWRKNNPDYQIWWMNIDRKGEHVFSFDKERLYNLFRDYPWELSNSQRQVFDEENPFWAEFFKDRVELWRSIDTSYDFTSELPDYWPGFWDRKSGLGEGGCDPDCDSPTLQKYQCILWSRCLPNGFVMELKKGKDTSYLTWGNVKYGSDSIIATFRYQRYRKIIEQVMKIVPDYKAYFEEIIHKSYTIGGEIIFPKHKGSMNQERATNKLISDRWDLTLECIRRYYANEDSPLSETIERDRDFFDQFIDFKGYVDFFFLQDAVADDYSGVNIWCGDASFERDGLPETLDEYFAFIDNELSFLEKRNARLRGEF